MAEEHPDLGKRQRVRRSDLLRGDASEINADWGASDNWP